MSQPTDSLGLPAYGHYPAAGREPRNPASSGGAREGTVLAEAAGMSRAPRTTHDDFDAIDRYVAATFARYQRALIAQLPTFAEPRVVDTDRAIKRLRFLVETLAGFAIGAAIGAAANAAKRGFGAEVRAGVGRVVGRILLDTAPRAPVTELLEPVPFLRDPSRPLLDALGAQLSARLCAAIPEVRTQISLIHAEITREAPALLRAFADALDRLAADDAPALAFADQLTAGWLFYAAAAGDGAHAATGATDAKGTWRSWTCRLAGPAPAPAPTQAQVMAEGFLMRIA